MARTSGSTSSTELSRNLIPVGDVLGAHGLRGALRVHSLADGPEALAGAAQVFLGEEAERATAYEVLSVAAGRAGELRLKLSGVRHRDEVEALRGLRLWVEAAELAALPEGDYYAFELVGCRVEAEDGTALGVVREIWQTGAPDVLVVEGADGRQRLIPAALLRRVDRAAGRAVVELLPGLLGEEEA